MSLQENRQGRRSNGEALTQLEDEEVRASREPTRGAASTGWQEYKGYKINLQG
jgi:hypothetical protein